MKAFRTRLFAAAATLALAIGSSSAIGQNVVDWTSGSSGTVPGATVTFSGGSRTLVSDPVWVNQVFSPVNMTTPVSTAEGIEFAASSSSSTVYTISFSSAVTGVMLHIGSLASSINFLISEKPQQAHLVSQ